MTSSTKYEYAVNQLEEHGVLHPGAHMFHQHEMYQHEPNVVEAIMTQLSLKAGLKRWGHHAHNAVHSEMKQLHLRDTFKPVHWRDLSKLEKLSVLESHMFLKEKRDGKIKGRPVTSRRGKQTARVYFQGRCKLADNSNRISITDLHH
jgi:hypothetical protein